jgi:hypothetical protein
MALLVLLTDCLFFRGVRECFAFAEGSAYGWGKAKCAICAVALKFKIFCAVEKN